jgi:hypothetical protein
MNDKQGKYIGHAHQISRRSFIRTGFAGCVSLALGAVGLDPPVRKLRQAAACVAWVQDPRAALGWSDQFSQRVDARVADEMLDIAMLQLTGQSAIADAWAQVFSQHTGGGEYRPGQKIAIKLNFNNSLVNLNHNPDYQILNALLRHLVDECGIMQHDIILYDATRPINPQFAQGVLDRFRYVQQNPPAASQFVSPVIGTRLTRLLDEVDYLINMPILRTHSGAAVSLSFKNHLGSVENPSSLHWGLPGKTAEKNTLVGLNASPQIHDKTLLVVADAIYGLRRVGPSENPSGPNGITDPWPNSVFVSPDPVAVDSVAIDFLANCNADFPFPEAIPEPRSYLQLAASVGLGVHESSLTYEYRNINLARCIDGVCTSGPSPST